MRGWVGECVSEWWLAYQNQLMSWCSRVARQAGRLSLFLPQVHAAPCCVRVVYAVFLITAPMFDVGPDAPTPPSSLFSTNPGALQAPTPEHRVSDGHLAREGKRMTICN